MKLPVRDINSPMGAKIIARKSSDVIRTNNVKMMAEIEIDHVMFDRKSRYDEDHPDKPYMRIMGHLLNLHGRLTDNVTHLGFDPNEAPLVDMFYEFNNNQLKTLIDKGLFEKGFKPDMDQFKNATVEAPVNCNFSEIAPNKDRKYPIYFCDVDNLHLIQLTEQNSGYDMTEYFENTYEAQRVKAAKEQTQTEIKTKTVDDDFIDADDLAKQDMIGASDEQGKPKQDEQEATVDADQLGSDMIGQENKINENAKNIVAQIVSQSQDDNKQANDETDDHNNKNSNETKKPAKSKQGVKEEKAKEKADNILDKALAKIKEREDSVSQDNNEEKQNDDTQDTTSNEHQNEVLTSRRQNAEASLDDHGDYGNDMDDDSINDVDDTASEDTNKRKRRRRKGKKGAHFGQNLAKNNDLDNDGIDDSLEQASKLNTVDAPSETKQDDDDDFISY